MVKREMKRVTIHHPDGVEIIYCDFVQLNTRNDVKYLICYDEYENEIKRVINPSNVVVEEVVGPKSELSTFIEEEIKDVLASFPLPPAPKFIPSKIKM